MGSYVRGVISQVTIIMTPARGLVPPLIATHEPPTLNPKPKKSQTLMLKKDTSQKSIGHNLS